MAKENKVDIKENKIVALDSNLLSVLLKDNSSGKNIIWATDDYVQYNEFYTKDREITIFSITGKNGGIIKPRVEKTEKGVKLGKYYGTDWTKEKTPISLPLNINNIDDIYTVIIDELIPISANQGEETSDFVARFDRINKLKTEIVRLQKQVGNERQSKRRFELNNELKVLKKELMLLND